MMPMEKDDLKTRNFKISAGARLVCGLFVYYPLDGMLGQDTTISIVLLAPYQSFIEDLNNAA